GGRHMPTWPRHRAPVRFPTNNQQGATMRNFTITTQHTYHISFDEAMLTQQLTAVTTDSVRPIMKAAEMVVRRYRIQFNHETAGTITKRDLMDAGVLGDLI